MRALLVAAACVASLSACSHALPSDSASGSLDRTLSGGAITHVVVIVQENRTVDNLFNGFPGADTVRYGQNLKGESVPLHRTRLAAPYDMAHRHASWLRDYDGGKMDGFSAESENCYAPGSCPPHSLAPYGFVTRSDVEPYWDMALQYTFADEMFQSNQGPSFPAHQYLISGTSTIHDGSRYRASENASAPGDHPKGREGGCGSLPTATVATIDDSGKRGPTVFPCFDRVSIMHDLDRHHIAWRYFQEFGGAGQWHAVNAIRNVWNGPTYTDVKYPSAQALRMVRNNHALPQVTFITPSAANSDHAGRTDGGGPDWVASIVNTIGKSTYWQNTAIIVVWDDWGGWYDHVPPQIYNSYEVGFRVPMIVISPFAKPGYVSHVPYEFGSILKFIEQTFGLESLRTTDARANDLSDCFNFTQPPRRFVPIRAAHSAQYFERQAIDERPLDDD